VAYLTFSPDLLKNKIMGNSTKYIMVSITLALFAQCATASSFGSIENQYKNFSNRGYKPNQGWDKTQDAPQRYWETPQYMQQQQLSPAIVPASVCQTPLGSCRLDQPREKGSFCFCITPEGPTQGVAQ
jgi:hypothetical protein